MTKEEALLLIDRHKNALLDPVDMLAWTWLRITIYQIPEDEWSRYAFEAMEKMK